MKPKLERLWREGPTWSMVTMNAIGFRCGYVCVEKGHPWYERDYDDINAHVHGGLTFSSHLRADLFEEHDGLPDGWWIGFDCGHLGDAPDPDVWAGAISSADIRDLLWANGHVWTTDEVAVEVAHLALQVQVAQVAEAANADG